MSFKRIPVESILVTMCCDKEIVDDKGFTTGTCGGDMKFTGGVLDCYPQEYAHRCDQCGSIKNEERRYPDMEFQPRTI